MTLEALVKRNMEHVFDLVIAGELNLDLILYGLPAEMPQSGSFWLLTLS